MLKLLPKDTRALLKAALGEIESDTVFTNARIVNVFTDEYTRPAETEEEQTEGATEEETVAATVHQMSADDIVNILVVGQAARAGEEANMADTTMLVSINTYTKEVTVFSILRDSFVKLPDYKAKLFGEAGGR